MLQRGADGARPSLALARVARTGGHMLETLGRFRIQSRGISGDKTWQLRGERLQRVAGDLCRVHGFDVRIDGLLPNRPAVLVANHVSYVDALVLTSLAPCTVIAKGEVRGWPLVGSGAETLGVLFVARGDAWSGARALRKGLRALEAGISVLGFPEGTTTRGDDVLPFRRGLFGLAQLAGVPIVPIALHYISPELRWYGDSWFLPHYLRTAMRPSSLVRVRVGAPIAPSTFCDADELAQRARSTIRSMLWRVRA
jgi:1-acyl-sn-glycerol-3-phosphate acyltransferase